MKELLELAIKIGTAVKKATEESVKEVGEAGLDIIVKRTRSGKTAQGPLKPLASSTIKSRQGKSLSSETSPSKSNLTETGRMLDSLEIIEKDTSDGKRVTIQADNVKDRNKTRGHARTGRRYLDFNDRDDQLLTNIVAKNIIAAINKIKIG